MSEVEDTEQLRAQLRRLREQMPALEFICPYCPFCGEETVSNDDYFDCEKCGLTWESNGSFLERIDNQPQCLAEKGPCVDLPGYEPIAQYRCVLGEGHENLHCGYRIDQPTGQIRSWKDETAVAR